MPSYYNHQLWGWMTAMQTQGMRLYYESAKLRVTYALVLYLPRDLRALLPSVPCALHALMPHALHVIVRDLPPALHALHVLILYVPSTLRALVPSVFRFMRALVLDMPRALRVSCSYVLFYFTCLVPCVFMCFSCLVPYVLFGSSPSLASVVSSLTCSCASHGS